MTAGRFNAAGLIIGKRGTGKTTWLLGDDKIGLPGLVNISMSGSIEKALMIMMVDHPAYRHIPILPQKDFRNFRKGIARIVMPAKHVVDLVDLINDEKKSAHMNNTFIGLEDAGEMMNLVLQDPFCTLISNTKTRNQDFAAMLHGWGETPTDIYRKGVDYLQVFKTEDQPYCRKKYISNFEKVEAVYKKVEAHPDNFYSVSIDRRTY